jgi:FkbM family methyltransferase
MQSYSQIGQDLEVLNYTKNKRDGYFVEVGANDGITLSNTYLLEQKYNWRGICAEPVPEKYKQLVTNRPNSYCTDKAVYNTCGQTLSFDVANTDDLFSGISQHIDKWKHLVDPNKTTINVTTTTLTNLLDQAEAPLHIDYLSLDTEGSEYLILTALDFNKYTFCIIHVEHNWVEPRRNEIKRLLESKGYSFVKENQWDDVYINPKYVSRI